MTCGGSYGFISGVSFKFPNFIALDGFDRGLGGPGSFEVESGSESKVNGLEICGPLYLIFVFGADGNIGGIRSRCWGCGWERGWER